MNLTEYHVGLKETRTFYNFHVSKVRAPSHAMCGKYTIHRRNGMSVTVNDYGMIPEKALRIMNEDNETPTVWGNVLYWDREESAEKGMENMIHYLFRRDYLDNTRRITS